MVFGYRNKEPLTYSIVLSSVKSSTVSWFSGGSRILYLAAIMAAGLAIASTVASVSSFKPYNPQAPPGPACPLEYDFIDGECKPVNQPISCPSGFQLEGETCQPSAPTCPDGYTFAEGQCSPVEEPSAPPITTPDPEVPEQPKPSPVPPPPEQPSDPDPLPAVIPFSELHGVNYIDPVLYRKSDSLELPMQEEMIKEFVPVAKAAGFNVFRIPVVWEAYVGNEANFLGELVTLVETANSYGIFVWIDFHQYDATSNWPGKVSKGRGFPEFIVSCYEPRNTYERDPEVRAFWNDYYTNKVRDSSNSCKPTLDVWDLHAGFMKAMIEKVDYYPNVIGYELMNEPHVWKDADYENLGEMNTAITKKLRASTDKLIIFTRETAHGYEPDGRKYTRSTGLEYKILPKDPLKNVMYMPHLYNLDEIENQVSLWKETQDRWRSMGYDVPVGVGEWSPQPPQLPVGYSVTQQNVDRYVQIWQREGWMHTYWAFGGFNFGEGNMLLKPSGTLTPAGKYFEKAISKFYPLASD